MQKRSRGWWLCLAPLAFVALSCASGGGVDGTPTLRITADAHVGKGWSSDSTHVNDISDTFTPTEPVYAIIDVPTRYDGSLKVVWVFNGSEAIQERVVPLQNGVNVYPFRLMPPEGGHKVGDYRLDVFINEEKKDTENFNVKAG